ncbi:ABC transporter ATP-binding protein [Diplocloster agilis]|uniref:ABC transporter ATP-binding protein n=1 Tax=Diplocloster agilis TaxID=2850323 RepID=UPI0008209958|nr:ABC transporter ATP-binding protein [Suonthocola fibrivorans]MCU6736138.1 ABC transporter ATP-binding protein [Suonthocola fibrivorans]SCJ86774.1 Glutathione import ATP-binding protein GsiA [uncultured Clostridium sp.]
MSENNIFLKVRDLEVEYTSDGKVIHAVNGVSFSIDRGKTLALVGETGAGKTTIAKSILGILPDRAARVRKGQIYLDGTDLLKASENEMLKIRGRKISMVFQDPMTALNPIMKVGSQIAETIRIHDAVSKKEAKKKAADMLNLVGIPRNRYNNYPHEFSGGMKQRVIIAMALACRPELLLADEPTTALDVTIQAQVIKMIKDLRDQFNMALILITHDLGVVADIADDVAVVYAGEIVEYGSKEDIYLHPKHPYTKALFNAIPNLETDVDRLENIKGLPPDPAQLPEGCCFSPRCTYAVEACTRAKSALATVENRHCCSCSRWKEIDGGNGHE